MILEPLEADTEDCEFMFVLVAEFYFTHIIFLCLRMHLMQEKTSRM